MSIIAILAADIHLQHTPPPARAGEPDWYAAMRRPLDEIRMLAAANDAVILYAGDIFDRWSPPVELVNFAITAVPPGLSIAGNHDLPNHNPAEIHRSAYCTLVRAGVLDHLTGPLYQADRRFLIVPFGFGTEVTPAGELREGWQCPIVAIIHAYIWRVSYGYEGAPDEQRVGRYLPKLRGYTAAVFGDNHQGFHNHRAGDDPEIFNCGTLMRRRSDEVDYKPQVGLLHSDGDIEPYYLDTSKDVFEATPRVAERETSEGMSEFFAEITRYEHEALDFHEAVRRCLAATRPDPEVRRRVLEATGAAELEGSRP